MKRTLLAVPLIAIAAAAVLLAWEQGSARDAEAGVNAGMQLAAPASAPVGTNFVLNVTASPAPPPISGYATEILLPAGLQWIPRATCNAEALANRVGGSNGAVCTRNNAPPPVAGTDPRHVTASEIAPPPLAAFDTPLPSLVQIDIQCVAQGTHQITLSAAPDAPFGAVYFAVDTSQIPVVTVGKDLDGSTTVDSDEDVADFITINCTVPTATFTPTVTNTPTATATPCPPGEVPVPGGGCAVPTETHTPTNTPPNTPTPTSLPDDTVVTLSGPADAPPGGAVDVTATVTDSAGDPLVGVPCTFTIVSAPEGSDASLAEDTATTDDQGGATVSVNVGSVPGAIEVQADCGGVASQVLAVNVTEGVIGPPTGESDMAGSIAMWSILVTVVAVILGGLGFAGWKKAAQAR
jgi:hypothetical protein